MKQSPGDEMVRSIGTCRLTNSLLAASQSFPYRVEQRDIYGYVHSTREVIQQIQYVNHGLTIPEHLWACISNRTYAINAEPPTAPSRYFVEVSALNYLYIDGFYLHLNRFKDYFAAVRDCLRAFMLNGGADQLSARRSALQALPNFHLLRPDDRRILLEATITTQSFDDLVAGIAQIRSMLPGDILFVSHCNVIDNTGELRSDRARAVKYLHLACKRLNLPSFDPSPLLAAYGQDLGLAKDGSDYSHYTPEFYKFVGEQIGAITYGERRRVRAAFDSSAQNWRESLAAARLAAQNADWNFVRLASLHVLENVPANTAALLLRARAVTPSQTAAIAPARCVECTCCSPARQHPKPHGSLPRLGGYWRIFTCDQLCEAGFGGGRGYIPGFACNRPSPDQA